MIFTPLKSVPLKGPTEGRGMKTFALSVTSRSQRYPTKGRSLFLFPPLAGLRGWKSLKFFTFWTHWISFALKIGKTHFYIRYIMLRFHQFIVVSKDADFQNSHLLKGAPERLLKINLGNISTKHLLQLLETYLPTLDQHFTKGKCMIEVGNGFIPLIE